ncbi:hypothetical protein HK405_015951, partial [Cladochytrium tenue]
MSLLLDIKIAGFVGLSGFVINTDRVIKVISPTNKDTPVMICTGGQDRVVRPERMRSSVDSLRAYGRPVNYHVYQDMGHSSSPDDSPEEMADLLRFLQA